MKKRALPLLLCLLCCLWLFPVLTSADAEGTCGDDLTWTFTSATGTLTISGSGAMYNYKNENDQPWVAVKQRIRTVSLPRGLTCIGDYAFYRCISLTSVNIPDTVECIGSYAFSWAALTSLALPEGVTNIGTFAFTGNSFSSLVIPKSVTSIGRGAFSGLIELSAIQVQEGNEYYTAVDGVLFTGDKKALVTYPSGRRDGSYTVPDGVEVIQRQSCSGNLYLTSVTIPGTVITIGMQSFDECVNLESVTIQNGVTRIGHYAFTNCNRLTSITIPASVGYIYGSAFANCCKLAAYYVDEANVNYAAEDGVLYSKDKTMLVAYPNGKGETCSIPNGVTDIGTFAFVDCKGLKSVVVPVTVSCIEFYAFSGCSNLKTVDCQGTEEQRKEIRIEENNDPVLNAAWQYEGVTVSKPIITGQPESVTVINGDKAEFTVTASGGDSITYTWYARASKVDDPWILMEGANTSTLTVEGTMVNSGWLFRCCVQNEEGATYSDTVTLTVTP